jgi:hypothetical protein
VAVLGAVAIMISPRYLPSAKTAEAKNVIGAIARGVQHEYEGQSTDGSSGTVASTHKLCPSAQPVPPTVPKGRKEMPDAAIVESDPGWSCLRFTFTGPVHYQYEYRVGGPYKGPSRGGPDPGPDGFEISAEGDLDGNGVTSLFTLTGKIDPISHALRIDSKLFVDKERE